ncbi:hypothetical protein [Thermostaphylospora chromogena]|uniref:Lipoprotein n=1 Tax=Thermostaphylospora chromogena TaxID=35622 RepID=A0A1H1I036_9ACTN|nr:hypothetical protein [Thermostaphylospora chromogena]SDR30718.1 hypothetical protein SAMN04489764_4989 [Thermostaphylospora chromogena]
MRGVRLTVLALAMAVTVPGCSSEPTLGPAAEELMEDVRRLENDDLFKNPLTKLRILQRPDKDIQCDEDKYRRVWRATADSERGDSDVDGHLDESQRVMENTLTDVLGYDLETDLSQFDVEDGRFIYGMKEDLGIKITVYVAPEAPTWRLHAMTACLSR